MRGAITWLIATLWVIGACVSASAQSEMTIRLTNGDWAPYLSRNAPHHGFASHIVTEAFALEGVKVEYGFFPWARALKLAKNGIWQGSVVWLDSKERREHFLYSDVVIPSQTAFFHRKDHQFFWTSYEDLKGVRIGGTLEYAYGEEFDAAEKAGIIKTDRAQTDDLGIKKLLKGRIEVFPGELMVIYRLIRNSFPPEEAAGLTHHVNLIHEQSLHLILSKKAAGSKAMLDLFNKGLKKLKASGKYEQIIENALTGKYSAGSP